MTSESLCMTFERPRQQNTIVNGRSTVVHQGSMKKKVVLDARNN